MPPLADPGAPPSGWDGLLDPGEAILWQGKPLAGVVFRWTHAVTFVFGLVFAGLALVWMTLAAQSGGLFWLFGLIHFSAGVGLAVLPPFIGAFRRRHTWYTLTDRRAFVATDVPFRGKRLKSYPIERDTPVDYRPGDPASLFFAHEHRRSGDGSRRVPVGFERIPDGEEVYALVRGIQRDRT